jgi:hypothetical protein
MDDDAGFRADFNAGQARHSATGPGQVSNSS